MKPQNLKTLEKIIEYEFKNQKLLQTALTHKSFALSHNERLEFLGDSVLSSIISLLLYKKFPNANEGNLSQMRSYLVCGKTLALIANDINLGDFLRLGLGEKHIRNSILANSLEAILGAIYLDSDYFTIEKIILNLFDEKIKEVDPKKNIKDSKTKLQEYLQSQNQNLIEYVNYKITGKDHKQTFHLKTNVPFLKQEFLATGKSKKEAEQKLAKKILEKIKQNKKVGKKND